MSRRNKIRAITVGTAGVLFALAAAGFERLPMRTGFRPAAPRASGAKARPNVLLLIVDDLNDWVGCLGGHPNAKTPHIDGLAARGVVFERAYAPAPLCNPSRTAILTGRNPAGTGIYNNSSWFRDVPACRNLQTLPQAFMAHGYVTAGAGKVFHRPVGRMADEVSWGRMLYGKMGTPNPPEAERFRHGMKGRFPTDHFNRLLDWAPLGLGDRGCEDFQAAAAAARFLLEDHKSPFFLACGIFRPHLGWYVPKAYFDMHPLEGISLPVTRENDLDDVPPTGKIWARKDFQVIKRHGQWKAAVQGYLASCSFADACVGHVLEALEKSPHARNTIVVVMGDHGWHLGSKDHWGKSALWEQTTRTPLIISAPGHAAGRCPAPVGLVDVYPTLVDLCGLEPPPGLDGHSLAALLKSPAQSWPYPVVMTHGYNNHAVRDARYRYIRYANGEEELYDHGEDPREWTNLAGRPESAAALARLRAFLPGTNVKPPAGR